jgi:hypothetical protein
MTDLQQHVDRRAKKKGLRGKKLSPATIHKEIVTLRTLWKNLLIRQPIQACFHFRLLTLALELVDVLALSVLTREGQIRDLVRTGE